MVQRLRHIVFDNFEIKIFSLVFALVLWLHVSTRGTSEVNFMVPLELRDIPDQMAVVGNVPGLVDIRVQTRGDLPAAAYLQGLLRLHKPCRREPGEATYTLTPSNVRAPGSVTIESVSPAEVRLRLEALARRTLPVKAELSGRPSRGYRVQKVETNPSSVMVEGPANMVRRLEYVQTPKIDINGISGNIERMAPLISPGEGAVKLYDDSVQVFITVSGNREIRKEEQ